MTNIPRAEQIKAMLNGSTMVLLDKYVPGHGDDVRKYLSVSREEIIDALQADTDTAAQYFERVRPQGLKMHDVTWLDGEEGRYRIFWSAHPGARLYR